MHGDHCEMVWVPDNPARGKAQGRITPPAKRALARWTADGNRSPEVDAISIPGRSLFADPCDYQRAIGHPKINRGGSRGTNDTWARTGRNVGATSTTVCSRSARHGEANVACLPECREQTCEGPKEPHERRRTATKREREDLRRPARLCELATGSGTPREEGAIWRMTRSGRRNPGEGARVVRVARERDDIK
jgi:hypothetical protein